MGLVLNLAAQTDDYTSSYLDLPYIGRFPQNNLTLQGYWSAASGTKDGVIEFMGTLDKSDSSLLTPLATTLILATTGNFIHKIESYGVNSYKIKYTKNSLESINLKVYDDRLH